MAQSVLQTLLGLPAFLFAVWLMYWSLPLGSLFFYLKVWKLAGPRNDVYQWCNFLVHAFCIRVRKYGKNEVYRDGPCMFLSNHRSWADFFVDAYLTEGRGQLMSRMAVAAVFPMFMLPVSLVRGCIVFKRGSIADKQGFNAWIDKCVADSPQPGICLFPEGHRSRLPHSLPLKRGMLHYAYSRKMPVQVVMSAHKEEALDEKRYHFRFGSTCVTGFSTVIHTSSFDSFDAFFTHLQGEWDKLWGEVFSADAAALPYLQPQVEGFPMPASLRASQLLLAIAEGLLLQWLMQQTWRGWTSVVRGLCGLAGVTGTLQQVLMAAPLLWLVVSVVCCWDSTLPRPVLAPDGSTCRANGSSRQKAA